MSFKEIPNVLVLAKKKTIEGRYNFHAKKVMKKAKIFNRKPRGKGLHKSFGELRRRTRDKKIINIHQKIGSHVSPIEK